MHPSLSSPISSCPTLSPAMFLRFLLSPLPLSSLSLSLSVPLQALLVRALLEYSQSAQASVPYGLCLVLGIFLMELMRSWSLGLMWAVNYRTAARLRGAALTLAFNKILRLRSTKDIGPGEVGDEALEEGGLEGVGGTLLQISCIIPHCGAPHANDWDGFHLCSYTTRAWISANPAARRREGRRLRLVITQLKRNHCRTSQRGNVDDCICGICLGVVNEELQLVNLCLCVSQLINICSSDGQRVYEAVSMGCLLAGGPLVGLLGLSYTAYFLGPTALLGSAVFILFYPIMVRPLTIHCCASFLAAVHTPGQ